MRSGPGSSAQVLAATQHLDRLPREVIPPDLSHCDYNSPDFTSYVDHCLHDVGPY